MLGNMCAGGGGGGGGGGASGMKCLFWGGTYTWTLKVCKIMAFMITIRYLGPLFCILLGLGTQIYTMLRSSWCLLFLETAVSYSAGVLGIFEKFSRDRSCRILHGNSQ